MCVKCGNIVSVATEKINSIDGKDSQRKFVCPLCKSSDQIEIIQVPQVFKYLLVELAAMNIRVDISVSDSLE